MTITEICTSCDNLGSVYCDKKKYEQFLFTEEEKKKLSGISKPIGDTEFTLLLEKASNLAYSFLMTGDNRYIQEQEIIYNNAFHGRNIAKLAYWSSRANKICVSVSKNFKEDWKDIAKEILEDCRGSKGGKWSKRLESRQYNVAKVSTVLSRTRLNSVYHKYLLIEHLSGMQRPLSIKCFRDIHSLDFDQLGKVGVAHYEYSFLLLSQSEKYEAERCDLIYISKIQVNVAVRLQLLISAYILTFEKIFADDAILLNKWLSFQQKVMINEAENIHFHLSPLMNELLSVEQDWHKKYKQFVAQLQEDNELQDSLKLKGYDPLLILKTFEYTSLLNWTDKYLDYLVLKTELPLWSNKNNLILPIMKLSLPEPNPTHNDGSITTSRFRNLLKVDELSEKQRNSRHTLSRISSDPMLVFSEGILEKKRNYYLLLIRNKGNQFIDEKTIRMKWALALKSKTKGTLSKQVLSFEKLIPTSWKYDIRKREYYKAFLTHQGGNLSNFNKIYVLETLFSEKNEQAIALTISNIETNLSNLEQFDRIIEQKKYWKNFEYYSVSDS